jgi:hypothetical protein
MPSRKAKLNERGVALIRAAAPGTIAATARTLGVSRRQAFKIRARHAWKRAA